MSIATLVERIVGKQHEWQAAKSADFRDVVAQIADGKEPDPDLIVRTGGEQRLSGFLLAQSAYSELMFLDCFWPDISQADLDNVYENFMARKRRFGK